MGHMFSCARYISIAGHTMREDKWEKKAYGKGIELQGKTLGIVGFGRIGQHLGVMAKAIGMKVVAFDIFHIPGIEEQLGIPYVEMDELLAMSDFVSVHAPAVDGGALISAENIAKMKDGVVIINTSRGTNVDEAALLAASGVRQGARRRSGRVRRRARHQQGAVQPPHGVLHAPHRRCHQRGAEAHRRGDRVGIRLLAGADDSVRPVSPPQKTHLPRPGGEKSDRHPPVTWLYRWNRCLYSSKYWAKEWDFMARTLDRYSWVSKESDSSSMMATATLEQWSATRS